MFIVEEDDVLGRTDVDLPQLNGLLQWLVLSQQPGYQTSVCYCLYNRR